MPTPFAELICLSDEGRVTASEARKLQHFQQTSWDLSLIVTEDSESDQQVKDTRCKIADVELTAVALACFQDQTDGSGVQIDESYSLFSQ